MGAQALFFFDSSRNQPLEFATDVFFRKLYENISGKEDDKDDYRTQQFAELKQMYDWIDDHAPNPWKDLYQGVAGLCTESLGSAQFLKFLISSTFGTPKERYKALLEQTGMDMLQGMMKIDA